MPMLLKITIVLLSLVLVNLLLLKFSCNKTKKVSKNTDKPVILKPQTTIELASQELAPTGS